MDFLQYLFGSNLIRTRQNALQQQIDAKKTQEKLDELIKIERAKEVRERSAVRPPPAVKSMFHGMSRAQIAEMSDDMRLAEEAGGVPAVTVETEGERQKLTADDSYVVFTGKEVDKAHEILYASSFDLAKKWRRGELPAKAVVRGRPSGLRGLVSDLMEVKVTNDNSRSAFRVFTPLRLVAALNAGVVLRTDTASSNFLEGFPHSVEEMLKCAGFRELLASPNLIAKVPPEPCSEGTNPFALGTGEDAIN